MSRRTRVVAYTVVAVAVVVAVLVAHPRARPAFGLVSSNPPDRATVAQAPADIDLTFTAAVDPELSHLAIVDGSGAPSTPGRPHLVAPGQLSQPVHVAAAGEVTVAYHVTSADGTEATGVLRFTALTGTVGAPGAARPSAGHDHGVDPVSAALLALDGLVALAVLVLLAVRRTPRARSGGSV